MENPRVVHRFLLGLLVAFTAAAVGASLRYGEVSILLGWAVVVGLFFVACGVGGLVNAVLFAPILWLLGKFASRRSGRERGFSKAGSMEDEG
jgi:hypothetical protein